jgi:transmembrane protein 216
MAAQQMLSSLPLQVLLYFHRWFDLLYVLVALLAYIFKGTRLPYPQDVLGLEIFGIVMIALIEPCRLLLASRGNKTESVVPILWNLGLSLPLFGAYTYYLQFQAFVLRLDQVLNILAIVLLAVEWVLAAITGVVFWQNRRA